MISDTSSAKTFEASPYYPDLVRTLSPFGEEVCRMERIGAEQVLAWSSNQFATINPDGSFQKIECPKIALINRVILVSEKTFFFLADNKGIYRCDLNSRKCTLIKKESKGVVPDTLVPFEGGCAWATAKSVRIAGKKTVEAKLPRKPLSKEQITTITSLGGGVIAAGTTLGKVVLFNQDGEVVRTSLLAEEKNEKHITKLIGNTRTLAAEFSDRVVAIPDLLDPKSKQITEHKVSLMPHGRSLLDGKLLMKYEKSLLSNKSPIVVWHLRDDNLISLSEPKFWAGSFAEFTEEGKVVGGGDSTYRPFRVWDAETGKLESETQHMQATPEMRLNSLGHVLGKSYGQNFAVANIAKKTIQRFSCPNGVKVESLAFVTDSIAVAAGSDGGLYFTKSH